MTPRLFAVLGLTLAGLQEPDAGVLQKMRQEGFDRSQVGATFDHFTTVIGPRLTGTPAYKAAAEWSKAKLTEWGLSNARLETWDFGRGWQLDGLTVEMVEPRYMPLIGYADAWSAATNGEIVGTPVFLGEHAAADVAGMKDKLRGAIVLTQPFASFIREDRPQPTTADVPVRIGQPQDYVDYDVRTHHTNMDTAERIRVEDLKQNAIVLAWFAYQAAMTSEAIPRVANDTR